MHSNIELSYQIYSEFKYSNWYIYWDKEYAYLKERQLLVVWHVSADTFVYFDYTHMKEMIGDNTVFSGLPYNKKLSNKDKEEFLAIANEWLTDIDLEFGEDE